jgi:hypothetical protein
MAREVQEREDLLRDATALVQRVELKILNADEAGFASKSQIEDRLPDNLFAGFRSQGEMSVYFGNDPVYQFTRVGSLRRAFSHGQIIKAQQGDLISWQRHRTNQRVEMIPHKLNSHEQCDWLAVMCQRLLSLQHVLETNAYQLVGQFPADGDPVNGDVVSRLHQWLVAHQEIQVADSPGIS